MTTNKCLHSFTFQDFNVFSLYISRLQCLQVLHFKTSMSSVFYISRLQCLMSLHFHEFNVFSLYILQDFNVFFVFVDFFM